MPDRMPQGTPTTSVAPPPSSDVDPALSTIERLTIDMLCGLRLYRSLARDTHGESHLRRALLEAMGDVEVHLRQYRDAADEQSSQYPR